MEPVQLYQCPQCDHAWKPHVVAHEGTRCPRCHKRVQPVVWKQGELVSVLEGAQDD